MQAKCICKIKKPYDFLRWHRICYLGAGQTALVDKPLNLNLNFNH